MELIVFADKERTGLKPLPGMLLPFDYHDFLKKTNGGIVLTATKSVQIPGTNISVRPQTFLGIGTTRKTHDLEYVNDLYKTQFQLPFGSIIIAVDYLGNLFFLNGDSVYYWDTLNAFPDIKQKTFCVAKSFSTFLDMLGGLDIQRPQLKNPSCIGRQNARDNKTKNNIWRNKK